MNTIEYSEKAKCRIESYLNAVQDRLKASATVDAQEVVDDLRGHIDRELSSAGQPVSEADARKVLDRLGLPEQVVDEGDMSWWRKIILRLHSGPEDWRLAYLSFSILIVGTALAGPFGIIASFLLSRAALSVATESEPPAKKWLIYPSLIIVYTLVLCSGLLWPAVATGGLVAEMCDRLPFPLNKDPLFDHDGFGTILAIMAGGGLGLSAWWSILWLVGRRYPVMVRVAFKPFAEHWTGRLFGKIILGAWILTIVLVGAIELFLWTRT